MNRSQLMATVLWGAWTVGTAIAALLYSGGTEVQGVYGQGMGKIIGGWGYVYASYLIAWDGITGYALYLWIRRTTTAAKERAP